MKKLILIVVLLLIAYNLRAEPPLSCHQYYPNIPGELLKPVCMDGNQ